MDVLFVSLLILGVIEMDERRCESCRTSVATVVIGDDVSFTREHMAEVGGNESTGNDWTARKFISQQKDIHANVQYSTVDGT